jgi:hypothetical protein
MSARPLSPVWQGRAKATISVSPWAWSTQHEVLRNTASTCEAVAAHPGTTLMTGVSCCCRWPIGFLQIQRSTLALDEPGPGCKSNNAV